MIAGTIPDMMSAVITGITDMTSERIGAIPETIRASLPR
jgi:hypothetical protein